MASLDLEELVPDLKASLRSPGSTEFDNVTDAAMAQYMRNAFWEAFLDGFLKDYNEAEGIISHRSDTTIVIPRDMQQLVILYSAIGILRIKLGNLKTSFRAKAGSVEYETTQSATVLKALLEEFTSRRQHLLETISESANSTGFYFLDSFNLRQDALNNGYVDWVA